MSRIVGRARDSAFQPNDADTPGNSVDLDSRTDESQATGNTDAPVPAQSTGPLAKLFVQGTDTAGDCGINDLILSRFGNAEQHTFDPALERLAYKVLPIEPLKVSTWDSRKRLALVFSERHDVAGFSPIILLREHLYNLPLFTRAKLGCDGTDAYFA